MQAALLRTRRGDLFRWSFSLVQARLVAGLAERIGRAVTVAGKTSGGVAEGET
ncbi:hypothetical protein AB0L68_37590 [Streptomyces sp. NPDC052164]|uniref:hypothetical protein n=1 Tax=Streptomyces sp. NPDC052164 TaxID=3155529 RepID=UPI00344A0A4D